MLFLAGLGCRLSYGLYWPASSDDFYRYLWDGRLLALGENPFAERPINSRDDPPLASDPVLGQAYSAINSPYYYSIYPPLSQLLFALAAWTGSITAGVAVLRLATILADVLLYHRAKDRLQPVFLALYWLNPLLIHEFNGNLHLEGYAILFLFLAIHSRTLSGTGLALALAVQIKLWPLLLLPLFRRSWRQIIVAASFVAGLNIFFFWFFYYPEFLQRFLESLGLYYGSFLFNSGPTALLALLLDDLDWPLNSLRTGSLILATFAAIFSGLHFFFKARRPVATFLAIGQVALVYALAAGAVHPWYILPALFFSGARPALLLWSFLIFFSYAAYLFQPAWLPGWFLFLEYGLLACAFLLEPALARILKKKGLPAWWQEPLTGS